MKHCDSLGIDYDPSSLKIKNREKATREFKSKFDKSLIACYLRTMAAMANGSGGKIIFGITDNKRTIIGIDNEVDSQLETDITNNIQQYLEPYIKFKVIEELIEDKKILAIEVFSSDQKPVICKKTKTIKKNENRDEAVLEEGAIYFRYGAKSSKIYFSDLQKIIKDEERKAIDSIFQNLKIMKEIGFQKVGIANIDENISQKNISSIYVSEETVKRLHLIDKCTVVKDKSSGLPAYYVVGNVKLRTGIAIPIPDADRILLTEALNKLQKIFKNEFPTIFTETKQLTFKHLKDIAVEYKIRYIENHGNHDKKYCYFDDKTGRFFYRSAFMDFIEDKIKNEPKKIESILKQK